MKSKTVSVALEHRFFEYKGSVYTKLSFPYLYWKDYLSYFDEVKVIARVQSVNEIDSSYKRVDGDSVTVVSMPYYVGVKQFLFKFHKLLYSSFKAVKSSDSLLLRSGNISNLVWMFAMLLRVPYLREYPGNIREGIIGFGGEKLSIKILAYLLDYFAKFQSKYSKANSYVSEYCREIYSSNKPSYVFSSFNADEITTLKNDEFKDKSLNLISVGRLEGEKGHRDLIEAISLIDFDVEVTVIGDGSLKESLENYSNELRVNAKFVGAVTDRDYLFEVLASSDIFVIPSHTEGMPRSLLEAMAIGLPCLGTSVGGIPEVLDSNMLFSPNDPNSCARKISELISNKSLIEMQSKRNIDFIRKNYSKKSLDEKKIKFWSELYR